MKTGKKKEKDQKCRNKETINERDYIQREETKTKKREQITTRNEDKKSIKRLDEFQKINCKCSRENVCFYLEMYFHSLNFFLSQLDQDQ